MSLDLIVAAEQEKRRRKREGIVLNAPLIWDDWLYTLFPKHFSKPFAKRHTEFWEWVESIQEGVRPEPFVGLWGRGGGKSSNAEAAAIRLAAKKVRRYAWYVSSTQEKADQHVETIGAMLEQSDTNKYYPELSDRALNKYGNSRGWRRSRLRTASGFTIDALGLDTGARGAKIDEQRPDLICHATGTRIFDGNTWMNVEDHPGVLGTRRQKGLEIQIWGLPESEIVTPEHKYWARYDDRAQVYSPQHKRTINVKNGNSIKAMWVEAMYLRNNHYIGMPIDCRVMDVEKISVYHPGGVQQRDEKGRIVKTEAIFVDQIIPEFQDDEWWWFFGLWWGDGHVAGKYQVGITVATTQPEILERVKRLLGRYEIKYSRFPKSGCSQIVFSHAALNRWLRTWKTIPKSQGMKKPPQWVEWIDFEKQKRLIQGYIDSDGYIDYKNKQVRITSVSLEGLYFVRRILARLNIPSTIRKGASPRREKFTSTNGKVIESTSKTKYDIQFRNGVKDVFGINIETQTRYSRTRQFIADGFLWSKIRSVSETKEEKVFVPIQTETHTYITHFGLSHNCIDDVDDLFDTFKTTLKKIKVLTNSILPAGSSDCAVLFIQNLIHSDSIASRLADGRADFLTDRIVSGPHPAIIGLVCEQIDGKFMIKAGVPTWEGQSLDISQNQIFTWGYSSFMQESQHEVDKGSGPWSHIEFRHIAYGDLPEFVRTAVWIDPAVSETDESDCYGISAGGMTRKGVIVGIYFWEGITSPEDTLERGIMKAIEIKSTHVGVETDQGGDTWRPAYKFALLQVKKKLKETMSEERYNRIVWPVFASRKAGGTDESTGRSFGSKTERNEKMRSDYERGQVVHMIGTHATIERALKRFPREPLDLADSWFWTWHDLRNRRKMTAQ